MIAAMMPGPHIITTQERIGKCLVREFTCYKSPEQKITFNPPEPRHLKDVVVSEPDREGRRNFRTLLTDAQRKGFPTEENAMRFTQSDI